MDCPFFIPKSKPELSERERQTLVLMAGGLTNPQIAEQLSIGERTVKGYVKSIVNKLGARKEHRQQIGRT